MSGMIIKRGMYTRVAGKIESNEGTYFETSMSPAFDIEVAVTDASDDHDINISNTHCRITGIIAFKSGAGGAGDSITIKRVRAGASVDICTILGVATASDGDTLVPTGLDITRTDLQPGDILRATSVKAAGSPAAELHIAVRIV